MRAFENLPRAKRPTPVDQQNPADAVADHGINTVYIAARISSRGYVEAAIPRSRFAFLQRLRALWSSMSTSKEYQRTIFPPIEAGAREPGTIDRRFETP